MSSPRVKCRFDETLVAPATLTEFYQTLMLFYERIGSATVNSTDFVAGDNREARGLMQIAAELMARQGIRGTVNSHVCSHPNGGPALWSCKDDPQAQYMEIVV